MNFRSKDWIELADLIERLSGGQLILMETSGDDDDETYPTVDWQDDEKGELCALSHPEGLLKRLRGGKQGLALRELERIISEYS